MSTAFLNGQFMPLGDVRISPLDRGFLFGDGLYEVVPAYAGTLFHADEHVVRLERGLQFIKLELGCYDWRGLLRDMVARNGGGTLSVYVQVTRGPTDLRTHWFPEKPTPTVFSMATPLRGPAAEALTNGVSTTVVPDIRWGACNIKALTLLPNVLARQAAIDAGTSDAILVRDGLLTETTAGNLFLVKDGELLTPIADNRILPGVTRTVLIDLARAGGITVREEDLPGERLDDADEVWLSSTTRDALPVTSIDGRPVGDGRPGPLWRRMWDAFQTHKREVCGLD